MRTRDPSRKLLQYCSTFNVLCVTGRTISSVLTQRRRTASYSSVDLRLPTSSHNARTVLVPDAANPSPVKKMQSTQQE